MQNQELRQSNALVAKLEDISQYAGGLHWCSEFRVEAQRRFITNPECVFMVFTACCPKLYSFTMQELLGRDEYLGFAEQKRS
jgi:hypothetical protein